MKKPIIVGIIIVIVIGIVIISLSDSVEQNNESDEIQEIPPLDTVEETKTGRNLEVFLEESVSMKTSP